MNHRIIPPLVSSIGVFALLMSAAACSVAEEPTTVIDPGSPQDGDFGDPIRSRSKRIGDRQRYLSRATSVNR